MIVQGVTLQNLTVVDAQPVTAGLAYYIDAGNVSSYSGTGSSINNIAGTAPGASTTTGSPAFTSAGQSSYFTFNGSTQYIYTANLIGQSLSGNITIECWVNTSTDNGVVVDERGQVGGGWQDSQIEIVAGNLKVATWSYSIGAGTVVGPVTRNVWQQYTLTQNATTTTGYINGSTTASAAHVREFSAAGLYYGIMLGDITNLGDGSYLAGNWSILKVYNRALTQAEVQQNFNAIRGRYGI
tara:strand:- start:27 stop:746 length:720 start_codon:yes stop_codon:yes gene_type:complete